MTRFYRSQYRIINTKSEEKLLRLARTGTVKDLCAFLMDETNKTVNINARDNEEKDFRTALHYACLGYDRAKVMVLLNANARVDRVDNLGLCPIDLLFIPTNTLASKEERTFLCNLLMLHGSRKPLSLSKLRGIIDGKSRCDEEQKNARVQIIP